MFKVNGNNITAAAKNPDTRDIIFYLCAAVPAAAAQVKPYIYNIITPTGNASIDGKRVAEYIFTNLKYKQDGYEAQKIQLPGRLLQNGVGDCKSFSLLFCACMTSLGYKNGFRFASYKQNKIPTHVYNFVLDNQNNILTFDTCVRTLKESPNYTYIKDMQVEYLTGVPTMIETGTEYIGKKGRVKKVIKKAFQGYKKIQLGPQRGAALGLIALNVRGLATKIKRTPADKVKKLWQRLGGDYKKLMAAVDKGANKKPVFGMRDKRKISAYYSDDESYIGIEPATTAALLASAAPILLALSKLFKSSGVDGEAGEETLTDAEAAETEAIGEKTVVSDTESSEAAAAQPPTADQDPSNLQVLNTGFKASHLLIGGVVAGIVLIYFLTKKKGRK